MYRLAFQAMNENLGRPSRLSVKRNRLPVTMSLCDGATQDGDRSMNARCVSDIVAVLEDMGRHRYGGEPVSQLEHALQCAALAERHGAEPALVVAALLHDIGHLVDADAESAAERGTDRHHELCGGRWLSGLLDDDVVEPVRLHVAAKRWLTATDPDYFSGLSPASVRRPGTSGRAVFRRRGGGLHRATACPGGRVAAPLG